MVNRGFGIELERPAYYGDTTIQPANFDPDWWSEVADANFGLNDDPVTKSGSSRMVKKARAGYMKPKGTTKDDADLQKLAWYFRGYLDNYKYTAGASGATIHTHEFWGGEIKELQSFRGVAVYDMLEKYFYGLLVDKLSLECSLDGMTVGTEWVYKTEKANILTGSQEFDVPDALTNEDIFIMGYDVDLFLNNNPLDGVSTSLKFDGNNNHNVDNTLGLGSRNPQKRACAQLRENGLEIATTLTHDTVRSILDAEYGEIGAIQPSSCKLLQLPLKIQITHCESSNLLGEIVFPNCTLNVTYDFSGADNIPVTMKLGSLGRGTAIMANNSEIETDMYVKLVNNQVALAAKQ